MSIIKTILSILFTASLLSGCHSAKETIYMGSDSIMAFAAEEIQWEFSNSQIDPTLIVDGRPGTALQRENYPYYQGFSWYHRLYDIMENAHPDVVVIAIGTNDANWNDMQDYEETVEKVYQIVKSADRVYWVNLMHAPLIGPYLENSEKVNQAIAKVDARHGNMFTINARDRFKDHARWFKDPFHLNDEGEDEYARMLREYLL